MKIEKYSDADYDALLSLYKKQDEFPVDDVTDARENIARKIERDSDSVIIVRESDKIVGTASFVEDGRVIWMFRTAVDPEHNKRTAILTMLHDHNRGNCA